MCVSCECTSSVYTESKLLPELDLEIAAGGRGVWGGEVESPTAAPCVLREALELITVAPLTLALQGSLTPPGATQTVPLKLAG